jgi:septal ring factor EnvC (AmiA/AmiB activator)
MLYASYKASRNQDRLTFLFSSGSFNQFLMRLKYFEQYGDSRRNQAKVILKVQELLATEIDQYEQIRADKAILLNEEVQEQNKLKKLQTRQGSLVAELAKKEKELNRELTNKKAAIAEINDLIDMIIAEELAARTAAGNVEIMELSSTFAGNQSKLPWPVTEGFISMGFGRQQHPVLKLVEVDNKGVYIQTQPKQEIKAVFDGKVSIVASIPGMNKAVIVQHGDFRTVYANLKNVYVVRNQEIKLNDAIGEIYTDNDGLAELYFELWQKNKTLNPQRWLSKK